MARKTIIALDCGVEAESWGSGNNEYLQISLIDLFHGYGQLNDAALLASLFAELSQKGYALDGMFTEIGYYDSIDDLLLTATKSL